MGRPRVRTPKGDTGRRPVLFPAPSAGNKPGGGAVWKDRAPTRRVGQEIERFERLVLPHLDAAYNLARWLTRNDADAADVVQEAVLRAFRYFGAFRGDDARGWLLATVRNTTWSWLKRNRPEAIVPVDEFEALAPESARRRPVGSLRRPAARGGAERGDRGAAGGVP